MSDELKDRLNARLRVSRLIQQAQDDALTRQAMAESMTTTVTCHFHNGPKSGEHVDLTVPSARGFPQRITIVAIDPESEELRKGYYRQSPLAESLYLWDSWAGPAEPIQP